MTSLNKTTSVDEIIEMIVDEVDDVEKNFRFVIDNCEIDKSDIKNSKNKLKFEVFDKLA